MNQRAKPTKETRRKRDRRHSEPDPREAVLADLATLRIPLNETSLDQLLREAEQEGLSHLAFLRRLLGPSASGRRERAIERRIGEARFADVKTLEDFDWEFNAQSIRRSQIEELATGEFVRRGDNLVMVGQSGVGKSHLLQALGRRHCWLGYRVRYTTSASLLQDLTASLADQTLASRLRYWSRFDLLIIDEFGFDKVERQLCDQAASLLYKVLDARSGRRSTALATNVDFDAWTDYLGDPPLAMAFLDRVVDGAIILKLQGKSYRAERIQRGPT